MNVYRITRYPNDTPVYASTLAEARTYAQRDGHRRTLADTRVDLIDVDVSKPGLIQLLNALGGDTSAGSWSFAPAPLRTWRLSPRGALIETTPGE